MSRGTGSADTPKEKSPRFLSGGLLAAFWLEIGGFSVVLAHPAGFEPTAYRLGVPKSVRLWHPLIPLECLILLDF